MRASRGPPADLGVLRGDRGAARRGRAKGAAWQRRGGLDADVPPGATVLLVDDQVTTGWTLTVAAAAIRDAGASAVLPLVLVTQG